MPLSRPAHIAIQDESSGISSVASTLNFIGAGVTASASGPTTTVNIPGGGGTSGTEFYRIAANDASAASKSGVDAQCDGTNDEVQINAGLASGRPVWLSEGNFNLGAAISVPAGPSMLIGSGWDTILNLNNSVNAYAILFAPGGGNFVNGAILRDFKLNCNGNNQTAGGGIEGKGAVWCKFINIWLIRPWNWGIWLRDDNLGSFGHHNEVTGCLFEDGVNVATGGNGGGILLEDSDEDMIHHNTFQGMGKLGGSPQRPSAVHDLGGLNSIDHNQFVTGSYGVWLERHHSVVDHNVFDGCGSEAGTSQIRINGNKNQVTNNRCYNIGFNRAANTADGIYMDNTQDNDVSHNQLRVIGGGSARSGINLDFSPINNTIDHNIFTTFDTPAFATAPITGGLAGNDIHDNRGFADKAYVRKTADESVTSSTTIQDDDHLFVSVAASVTYEVLVFVLYEGATTGDMTIGFSGPAGATFDWAPGGQRNDNATIQVDRGLISTTKIVGTSGTGAANHAVAMIHGILIVGTTAGTFRFRFAQGTSDATATTVLTGSYMRLKRIA
jgi:hypothetical protein